MWPSDAPQQFQFVYITAYTYKSEPAKGSLFLKTFSMTLTAPSTQPLALSCKSHSGTSYTITLTADSTKTIWSSDGPVEIKQV